MSELQRKIGCKCCQRWNAAITDLHTAAERMLGAHIFEEEKKDFIQAYRNGVAAVGNRFEGTSGLAHCPGLAKDSK